MNFKKLTLIALTMLSIAQVATIKTSDTPSSTMRFFAFYLGTHILDYILNLDVTNNQIFPINVVYKSLLANALLSIDQSPQLRIASAALGIGIVLYPKWKKMQNNKIVITRIKDSSDNDQYSYHNHFLSDIVKNEECYICKESFRDRQLSKNPQDRKIFINVCCSQSHNFYCGLCEKNIRLHSSSKKPISCGLCKKESPLFIQHINPDASQYTRKEIEQFNLNGTEKRITFKLIQPTAEQQSPAQPE